MRLCLIFHIFSLVKDQNNRYYVYKAVRMGVHQAFSMEVHNAQWMANCLKMGTLTDLDVLLFFIKWAFFLINFATSLKLLFFVDWTTVICDIRGYLEKEACRLQKSFWKAGTRQGQRVSFAMSICLYCSIHSE